MRYDGAEKERELIYSALTARDKVLTQLLFFDPDSESTPELIRTVFNDLNMEAESRYFRVMLSVYGHMNDWRCFPPEWIPRFRGIYQHFREDNEIKFSLLVNALQALEAESISPMIIKGGAMYAVYWKDTPRVMDDYDVAVREKDFARAAAVLETLGYRRIGSVGWADTYQAERGKKTVTIDLHRRVFKYATNADAEIWAHAVRTEYRGVKITVPSPEDMCLHLMDTQIRNLFYGEHLNRRIKWVADWCAIRSVYPEAVSPAKLKKKAEIFYDSYYIRLALRILEVWFPECFSPGEVISSFPEEAGYYKWIAKGMVYRASKQAVIHYPSDAPMTLKYIRLMLPRRIAEYRFMAMELTAQYGRSSFLSYFLQREGIRNPKDALEKYLPRVPILQKIRRSNCPSDEREVS